MGQKGFTLLELLAVMAIIGTLTGVVAGAVVGLGNTSQSTRLSGDANTIGKGADRFFTESFPQTYPVAGLDTNGDGVVDDSDDFDLPGGDVGVRLIDFDAAFPQDATKSFVPDFMKEVPDSSARVSWRVDIATGHVFFTEDGAALVRQSLARLDIKAEDTTRSSEEAAFQSDHIFDLNMRQGESPINTIKMTIPAGYVIGGQQLSVGAVVGSLEIKFEADNPWDTGNELTITSVPVEVVSGDLWKAVVNYDRNTGGSTADVDVKNTGTGNDDERTHTIEVVPPSGDDSPGILTITLDRTTEGAGPSPDFEDYDDPDVNEATEIFTLTLFDHAQVTLGGADVDPEVSLMTNPKAKGISRWLAEQNTAIDAEGAFADLAGNQAVVFKSGAASPPPEPNNAPTPEEFILASVFFLEPVDITLTGFDADLDPLSFEILTLPEIGDLFDGEVLIDLNHGFLTGDTVSYVPFTDSEPDVFSDGFSFGVFDGIDHSVGAGTVFIEFCPCR